MARATVPGEYRVTRAITHHGRYYKAGDVVTNDGALARIFGWELVASASQGKGARKPAVKK